MRLTQQLTNTYLNQMLQNQFSYGMQIKFISKCHRLGKQVISHSSLSINMDNLSENDRAVLNCVFNPSLPLEEAHKDTSDQELTGK